MTSRLLAVFISLLISVVSRSSDAAACACCSYQAQRLIETHALDASTSELIRELNFSRDARVFVGEADVEGIAGLTAHGPEFRVAVSKSGKAWEFQFDQGHARGTIRLGMPMTFTRFEVDTRNRSDESGQGPLLYKEWRITANLQPSGALFPGGSRSEQATLIFHGHGNACTDASQFEAWTLVLHRAAAEVTFYGSLDRR